MQALKIRDDVYWVGVQDPDLKIFGKQGDVLFASL
jgi:flavorubredoxin